MKRPHDLRDDVVLEALLRASLPRDGWPAPFTVDVAEAVMARVAEAGPAPRAELTRSQVVRWAIAASLVGIALIAAAAWHGPSLDQVAFDLSRTTAETAGTAAKLSRPAESVAQIAVRSAVTTWEAARTLARPLDAARPLAQLVLAWVAAGMIGFSTFVIGRDLRLLARHKEQA